MVIPEHSSLKQIFTVNDPPVYLIKTKQESMSLNEIIAHKKIRRIALDQERAPYNKFYFQKPSLLQIAFKDNIFFIDLLIDPEVTMPLKSFLEDPVIEKIFFDSPWDLYYFQEFLDIEVKGVKDIQICSSLLNPTVGTTSLIALAHSELGSNIQKSKKQQKSDWTKRPLTKQQIKYASEEIATFLPIYNSLLTKIKKLHLFEFFEYGNQRLSIDLPNLTYSPDQVRRIKGYGELTNIEKQRLTELGKLRDKIARKRDKPSFFIMPNDKMLKLAKNKQSINSILHKNRFLTKSNIKSIKLVVEQKYVDQPLPIIQNNFSDYPILKQHLLTWRFTASKQFSLPKRLILSKKEIDSFPDSFYTNIETLKEKLWFWNKKNKICQELMNNFMKYLKETS
ncbi:MAG: HRDC domain-containing protein [Candidatus Hodarchaeales archaeon]